MEKAKTNQVWEVEYLTLNMMLKEEFENGVESMRKVVDKANTEAHKAKDEANKANAEANKAKDEANKANAEANKAKDEANKANARASRYLSIIKKLQSGNALTEEEKGTISSMP